MFTKTCKWPVDGGTIGIKKIILLWIWNLKTYWCSYQLDFVGGGGSNIFLHNN